MSITSLTELKPNPNIPDITPGDTVKVSSRIVEGGKERIQVLQGVVIKVRHGGAGASFTVRHVAYGVGVERTFPLYSPLVEKVELVRHGKVRRAKIYYLRKLSGKAARRKIKRVEMKKKDVILVQEQPHDQVQVEDQEQEQEQPQDLIQVEDQEQEQPQDQVQVEDQEQEQEQPQDQVQVEDQEQEQEQK